jgi:hypothetical protein
MTAEREVVLYHPSSGTGFGHTTRVRGTRRRWNAVRSFLDACTIAEPPTEGVLTAYKASSFDAADADQPAEACIAHAIAEFGVPPRAFAGHTLWPSGEVQKGGRYEWDIATENVEQVVDHLVAGEPWPSQAFGPIELRVQIKFRWKDPQTGKVLPGQEAGTVEAPCSLMSKLTVVLGPRLFIQPALWFPFPEGSASLAAHVRWAQEHLPFRLHPNHFRVGTLRADGTGSRMRKLVLSPLEPI